MKIGLLVPMDEEIELILSRMNIKEVVLLGKTSYHIGTLLDKTCIVAMSGIGKVAAAITATLLIEHFKVDMIIVTGTAGGVGDEVKIGDICIATESVQHDMNATPFFPRFQIPLLGVDRFEADIRLVNLALAAANDFLKNDFENIISDELRQKFYLQNPGIHTGLLASGDQFIKDSSTLNELKENLAGLVFIEMEGAAVAQVCYKFGVPLLNVRIVSDNADGDAHINFSEFLLHVTKYYTFGVISHIINRL